MYWLILVVIKVKKMIVWLHTPAYLLFHTHTHTHIRTHTLTHHHQGWYIYTLHQLCPGATTHCAMHESRGRVISVTLPYVPLPRQLLYHRLVHTVAKVGLPLVHPSSRWFLLDFQLWIDTFTFLVCREALLSVAQSFFEHVDIGDESIKVGPSLIHTHTSQTNKVGKRPYSDNKCVTSAH